MALNKQIVLCAQEILENSVNTYIRRHIEDFIKDYTLNGCCDEDMLLVLSKIIEDGFDIKGFGLYEIPLKEVYCFYNKEKKQEFHVCLKYFSDINICFGYVDKESNEAAALTIQKAIEKGANLA